MTDLLDLREDPTGPQHGRRRARGPGRFLAVLVVLVLLVGLVGGAVYVVGKVLNRPSSADYTGAGQGSVVVQIEPGQSASGIGKSLAGKDVVKSELAFFDVTRDDPRAKTLQPGYYRLRKQMSAASAFSLLLDPAARLIGKVTIPEGLTVAQTLAALAKGSDISLADYEAAAKNTTTLGLPSYAKGRLEGFLFPATYQLDPGTTAQQVLKQLVARFNQAADTVGLVAGARAIGRSPYDVVIVASLIEREVKHDDEYAKVAQVVYNRLDRSEPLGIDASTLFGVGKTGGGQLTKSDLARDTPYETRRRAGLPPTPIASPGEATLTAALHPTGGDIRWYVLASKDGSTKFFTNYQDFLDQTAQSRAEGLF